MEGQRGHFRQLWNKWTKGERNFVRPPLPPELLGGTGCRIDNGVLDPETGNEVFITILEQSDFSHQLAAINPFKISCKTGMGNTNYGPIIFLIFCVLKDSKRFAAYEMFLNPFEEKVLNVLAALKKQTHVKVFLHDSDLDEIRGFYEFENNFDLENLIQGVALVCSGHPPGDFTKAQREFMNQNSLEDMLDI